jgi:hypothetical protein
MKPGQPLSLKEVLDPKPPAIADLVTSVPPPEMATVEAPQLMPRPGDVGFPGRTLDGNEYMASATNPASLPRWVRVTGAFFALLNLCALVLWLLARYFDVYFF